MTDEQSIGIHFLALDTRERAIFDRVIAFNGTHGLKTHLADDINHSDLIISCETALPQLDQYADSKTILILTNVPSCTSGDIQIARPLLITKVMNSLGDAIELVKNKPDTDTDNTDLIDIIDDYDKSHEVKLATEVEETIDSAVETMDADPITEDHINSSNGTIDEENPQSGHHALVIDDSASIRKQLELELRDAGITSEFAESGEDALEKIKEGQFDLIFLDIIMPGIDGYETCKAMRATAEYKKTPIIMLSGKTSPLDEVQGVIAGATTYLTKPVKSDKLQETLNRVTKWIDNYSATKTTETA